MELILLLVLSFVATGLILHGMHVSRIQRGWQNIVERPGQQLGFRFILQPVMGVAVAIRDGIRDARTGRPAYLWSIVAANASGRGRVLREGIVATGRIFLIAVAIDLVYQLVELRAFYPIETLVVAVLLAFFPYLLVRGPAARVARRLVGGVPKRVG